ncbi:glycosyltransferase, partial [Fulvivirga sp. RKSG066]|nr:glycosyltransferase [Fulvivirga aurantia]
MAKKLHEIDSQITLKIIGFCSIPSTLKTIKQEVEKYHFISLAGGDNLVPHQDILKAIVNADFGIIHYPHNYSTMNSTPTKLYEYLGLKLPILIQD